MKTRLFLKLTAFIVLSFSFHSLLAVPACPYPVEVKQPNGETIKIKVKGDEFFSYQTTEDEHVIVQNDKGYYVYSDPQESSEKFVPTDIVVHNSKNRSKIESNFLMTAPKGLTEKQKEYGAQKARAARVENESIKYAASATSTDTPTPTSLEQRAIPTSGARKILIILVSFQDVRFTYSNADFNNMMNQSGYNVNGATGSVRDYYINSSWNQFQPNFDVFGPVVVSQNRAYYGNDTNGNAGAMIKEACQLADAAGANFANYDTNNDGTVDNVYCFFAGYDQAQGGPSECIWSHASSVGGLTLDGKKIGGYGCSSELKWSSGADKVNIGTFCHEFGHVCGLPDFYDTDGNANGNGHSTAGWTLMASGCYNNDSRTPPLLGAMEREMLGWCTIPSCPSGAVTLNKIQNSKDVPAYKINTPNPNEYYVLEYREKTGFDNSLPGSGMLIWHVDKSNSGLSFVSGSNTYSFTYNTLWSWNSVNNVSGHPCYDLVESNGSSVANGDVSLNSAYIWPNGASAFNPYSWAGINCGSPITNIANHGTYATFNCGSTCVTEANPVATFYYDANYSGTAVGMPEGTFTTSGMGTYCLGDNVISSIKVLPGYKVTVYTDNNFGGTAQVYTASTNYVGASLNDQISSIKIEAVGVSGFSGIYKIRGRNSGKYMDMNGNGTGNETAVVQWDDEGEEAYQQFNFTELGNGVYSISSVPSGRVLDITAASTANFAGLQIYDNYTAYNQQFILISTGDGYYQFVARHCGKVLEVPNNSLVAGEQIKLFSNNNQTCSHWSINRIVPTGCTVATFYGDCNYSGSAVSLPEGDYTLAKLKMYGLKDDDISSIKMVPGFKVTAYTDDNFTGTAVPYTANIACLVNDGINDKVTSFKIEAVGISGKSGIYKIKGRSSGLYMDVQNNGTIDGTKIIQNTSNTGNNQQFQLQEISNGIYTITGVQSGKVFDVASGACDNWTSVQLWAGNSSKRQQYILLDAGNGYYQLVARHSGRVLEVPYDSKDAGAEIKQYDNNKQLCSQWTLEGISYDFWIVNKENLTGINSYLDIRNNDVLLWGNLDGATTTGAFEGTTAIAWTVNPAAVGSWFGFGIHNPNYTYDFSKIADYTLHFAIKTNDADVLAVKLTGTNGTERLVALTGAYAINPNNTWQEVYIPMSAFTAQGLTLGSLNANVMFSIVCESVTTSGNRIEVDDIYFRKITAPTSITVSPATDSKTIGEEIIFTVTATGVGLTYQWQKDGVNITGATASTYTINSLGLGNTGTYTCIVTNSGGSVTSSGATLTVNYPTFDTDITDNGGYIEASSTGIGTTETIDKLTDNAYNTKYCTSALAGTEIWIEYQSPRAVLLNSYSVTSANDFQERDPKAWKLQGTNDGTNWIDIDVQTNQTFKNRYEKKTFNVSITQTYYAFRLLVSERYGSTAAIFQLAEWQLFGDEMITTGENKIATSAIVYPNPATEYTFIEVQEDADILIYDMLGQLKFKGTLEEGKNTIDVNSYTSGIYLIKILNDSKEETIKLKIK